MSEQPLSVSPAVFLVIFCRGDVATYGESERASGGNMADPIWSGRGRTARRKKKRSANVFKMEERERREIKKRNVS